MTTTVKVTYTAEDSPNTVITFDLTGMNIESIMKERTAIEERNSIQNLVLIRRRVVLK
jgi:hypothetical protein